MIAAYDPGALGSLIGDKANTAVFDNSKIKRFDLDALVNYPAARPGPVSAGIEGRITKIP
ncbi:MAG: hypothetical protein K6U03_00635 [Firmicutes bacterium]|nr:hypothetical protein [Bacillota bacterium]